MDKNLELNLMLKEDKLIAKMLDTRLDLRIYSDNELSLIVFNTWELYQRIYHFHELKEVLKAGYIFNRKQYKVLLKDIKEYLES
jgi:protein associated with RNAse G/E